MKRVAATIMKKYEGLWRRKVIHRSSGVSDFTTAVWWFQTESFHIDLRIPVDAKPNEKTGFAGLTNQTLTEKGEDRLEWRPEIAFPHLSEEIDAGYMHFIEENVAKEIGVCGTYEEEWFRVDNGEMTYQREVKEDGRVQFLIEGSRYKAEAIGTPTDRYDGNEGDSSKWTSISVYEKASDSDNWVIVASTT